MKKTVLFLGCIALFVASCNKIETVEEPVQDSPRHLKVNIKVNNAETRAVRTGWTAGDKIYVSFDVCFQEEISSYLTLTYTGSSWTSEFSDDVLEELLLDRESGNLAAAYIASDRKPVFQYEPATEASPYNLNIYMTNSKGLTGMYLSADNIPYTVESGTLTAELNMGLRMDNLVHFSLDGISPDLAGNYTLRCDKLTPMHFSRFTYVMIDIPDAYHLELGPWSDFALGMPGDPILASYYYGGLEFNCYLESEGIGSEKEFIFYLVNNNGTPEDTSDDITYSLTKTATFWGKDAIRFPSLEYSGEWEVLTPSDINPEFNGYNNEVAW
ncbi:MAG: hypothetical protein IKV62_04125 [Bacteroidales bacterium]|nr:hypothetical protein [Bacteroidales bacterium]